MARNFPVVPWLDGATLYEVNIRQYTPEGSFSAFATHLPRLAELGVKILWLMPVTPISKEGRKGTLGSYYACADYKAVNPEYGTLDDLRQLVQQAHALGMQVILDWVANHTGLDHVWTQSNPGFYKRNLSGKFYDSHGWDDVIDLNYYDGTMRHAMIDAMAFWIRECDIDGFRCDMAHLVPRDFWRQARTALDPLKPLFWLAETEDLHYLDVFDSCYSWRWMHATEDYRKKTAGLNSLIQLAGAYENDFPASTLPLFFTSNHDENSWNGTDIEKYGDALKALSVFNFTWYGLPLLYSGQELPNEKRLKFFDKDQIDWNRPLAMQEFYKQLISIHATHPAILAGANARPQWVATDKANAVLAFTRRYNDQELLVILNLSADPQQIGFASATIDGNYTDLLNGGSKELKAATGLYLGPWGYFVGKR